MATMAATLDFQSERHWLFLIYKSPWCFLSSFQPIGFSVQEKKRKIVFQEGHHGGHIGYPIGTILTIFIYKLLRWFLPSFESIGLSVQEKKGTRFSRWPPWRPSWIFDWNNFSCFWSSHSNASYQVSSQLAQGCKRSRLLKRLSTPHDARRTLTDHNSSPWALRAQVS